jgi:hypothetical protein
MLSMKRRSQCSSGGKLQPPGCFWSREVAKAPHLFKELFDGTLGDWNTEPVSLKLKEGAKPCNSRCFPTPKVHKDTLKNEIERLYRVQSQGELLLHSYPRNSTKLWN